MALSLPPGAAASVGGASAGGQRTTSTGSLYDSHVYIKAEPGGKAQVHHVLCASWFVSMWNVLSICDSSFLKCCTLNFDLCLHSTCIKADDKIFLRVCVQTGKRAAASQGGPQKKAPRLDIPETGLMCLPTTNLSNISDGSPGSLVAAL